MNMYHRSILCIHTLLFLIAYKYLKKYSCSSRFMSSIFITRETSVLSLPSSLVSSIDDELQAIMYMIAVVSSHACHLYRAYGFQKFPLGLSLALNQLTQRSPTTTLSITLFFKFKMSIKLRLKILKTKKSNIKQKNLAFFGRKISSLKKAAFLQPYSFPIKQVDEGSYDITSEKILKGRVIFFCWPKKVANFFFGNVGQS